jgi:hypothetical protein
VRCSQVSARFSDTVALLLERFSLLLERFSHVVARFSGTAGECVDFSIGFAHSLGVFFKDLFDSLESPICCLRALICCLSVFLALLLDSLECSAS